MFFTEDGFCVPDNGGRRTGIERRSFKYCAHVPERRSAKDRRITIDRRAGHSWQSDSVKKALS